MKWLKEVWEWIEFVWGNKNDSLPPVSVHEDSIPIAATSSPAMSQPAQNPDVLRSNWDSQQNNFHNVRVLCDLLGLTIDEKNLICACIYQESQFFNYKPNGQPVTHENYVKGVLASTDWGICQINDYWHVKKYPDFVSVESILKNPDKAVEFMIHAYLNGNLKQDRKSVV